LRPAITVNRIVAVVKPKEPFLEWCRVVFDDPEMTLEDVSAEPGAYLLPDYDDGGEHAFLRGFFELIFAPELEGWIFDEDAWPQERDFDMFLEWCCRCSKSAGYWLSYALLAER